MEFPDIYFLPQWAKLNQEKDNGEADEYYFESEFGQIYYPYIKRKIDTKIDGQVYYDIITPYGFNGPIVLSSINKEKLLSEFDKSFTQYCLDNNLVSEFVRFSPWLMNHLDFKNYYSLKHNNQTLFIDLKKDFFTQEFSGKSRNTIRKAQKSNISIEFDFEGMYIDDFHCLYNLMANKNQIDSYYLFDKNYIEKTFHLMKGNVFIVRAVYEGFSISSAMFLFDEKYVHYHLSGNNYEFTSLGANSLILFEVSKWGQSQGLCEFHLGGAFDIGLLKYKSSFTKEGFLNYYIGTRIRDSIIYSKLLDLKGRTNTGFFPEYRN